MVSDLHTFYGTTFYIVGWGGSFTSVAVWAVGRMVESCPREEPRTVDDG